MSLTDKPMALAHRLGPFHVFLLAMSALSPALSVFVFGGEILKVAGTGAALAFLCGAMVAVVWAMIYGELGDAFPHAGGEYAGINSTLGGAACFAEITIKIVVYPASLAMSAVGFASYLRFLWSDFPVQSTAALALAGAGLIGILNIRTNVLITGLFLGVELMALCLVTFTGLAHPERSLTEAILHPVAISGGSLAPVPLGVLALAAIAGAYATVGGNQAINFGEEMDAPKGHMGWVVLSACLVGAVFTAGPMLAAVLGAPYLAATLSADAPLSALLSRRISPLVAGIVSVAVAGAVFNALLATVLQQSRFLYSLSRDGLWTSSANAWLTRLHPRFRSPWTATIALCALSVPLCFLEERTLLVLISSDVVFSLALVSLSVIAGRRRNITGGGFRSPLFPLFPMLGLLLSVLFAVSEYHDTAAGRPSLYLCGGLLLAGWLYFQAKLRNRPGGWAVKGARL